MGDRFLGHVERCRALLHLVDGAGRPADEAYTIVRTELVAYGQGLESKPEIIALNKADALAPEQLREQVARLERAAGATPFVISAVSGAGVPEALRALISVIAQDAPSRSDSRTGLPAWQP